MEDIPVDNKGWDGFYSSASCLCYTRSIQSDIHDLRITPGSVEQANNKFFRIDAYRTTYVIKDCF
jgi:hypothetical protein